jgi:hypothetical protein
MLTDHAANLVDLARDFPQLWQRGLRGGGVGVGPPPRVRLVARVAGAL